MISYGWWLFLSLANAVAGIANLVIGLSHNDLPLSVLGIVDLFMVNYCLKRALNA